MSGYRLSDEDIENAIKATQAPGAQPPQQPAPVPQRTQQPPQQPAPAPQGGGLSDADINAAIKATHPVEEDSGDFADRFATNFPNVANAGKAAQNMFYYMAQDPSFLAQHPILTKGTGSALAKAGSDIWDMMKDAGSFIGKQLSDPLMLKPDDELNKQAAAAVTGAGKILQDQAGAFTKNPIDALYGLAYGITGKPIQDLFESAYGRSMVDLKPLTVDQRASVMKDVAANAVAVGIGVGGAKLVPASGFVGRTAKAMAVGGAAGAGYGAVGKANDPDQLASALSSAIVFSTFGTLLGAKDALFHPDGKASIGFKPPSDAASDAAHLQQLQSDAQSTLAEAAANAEAAKISQSIPEAAMRGTLGLAPDATHILPGVRVNGDLPTLLNLAKESKIPVITRMYQGPPEVSASDFLGPTTRPTMLDFLFPGKDANVNVGMWRRTGFLPQQRVAMGGTEYTVLGEGLGDASGPTIELMHDDGTKIDVSRDVVRHIPGKSFTSPNVVYGTQRTIVPEEARTPLEGRSGAPEFQQLTTRPNGEPVAEYKTKNGDIISVLHRVDENGNLRIGFVGSTGNVGSLGSENIRAIARDLMDRTGTKAVGGQRIAGLAAKGERLIPREQLGEAQTTKPTVPSMKPSAQFSQVDVNFYNRMLKPQLEGGVPLAELTKNLPPEEQRSLAALHDVLGATTDPDALVHTANANGYYITARDGGYIIRDAISGNKLTAVRNAEEAMDVLRRSGQQRGLDINDTGDGSVPPNTGRPLAGQPPSGPENWQTPYTAPQMGVFERLNKALTLAVPWLSSKEDFLKAVDSFHETQFTTKVLHPVRNAWMRWLAQAKPMMDKLQVIDKMLSKTNATRRAIIGGHIQTMSIPEIISGLFENRAMNSTEIAHAQWLADNNIDIDKIYQHQADTQGLVEAYQKTINQLTKENSPGLQTIIEGRKAELQAKLQEMNDKLSPQELEANARFIQIKRAGLDQTSLYGITTLARAYQDPHLAMDQATYAKFHKMTPTELTASRLLTNIYKALADIFNIPDARRFSRFLNHYRATGALPDEALIGRGNPLLEPRNPMAPGAFASDLVRSGALTPLHQGFIDDPVQALSRYIQQGYRARSGFNEAFANAKNVAQEELKNVTPNAQRGVANVLNEFLNEARGIPDSGRGLMQEAFNKFLDALGVKMPVSLRNDILNGGLALTNSAMLGFKPELAMRDLTAWWKLHYARFGTVRAMNAFKAAFEIDPETGMSQADHLILAGEIPGLSPIDILSPEEVTRMQMDEDRSNWSKKMKLVYEATRKATQIGTAGLKFSGQQSIYAKIHAGAYLEAQRLARSNLIDLAENRITKAQAYKNLDIDSYDAPIQQRFNDLVTSGRFEDAATFLGKTTAVETAFIHGFGQHPYLWGTNVGRLLGQFGMWPVWDRNYVARLATRGSLGARTARMARLTAAEGATVLAGKALGFNLQNWMVATPRQIAFGGGPIVHALLAQQNLIGRNGQRAQNEAVAALFNQFKPGGMASMFIPGYYAFHDYAAASILADKGYGAIPVLGKGLGFSVDETGRSFLDDWMGNYPEVKPQESATDTFMHQVAKMRQ